MKCPKSVKKFDLRKTYPSKIVAKTAKIYLSP